MILNTIPNWAGEAFYQLGLAYLEVHMIPSKEDWTGNGGRGERKEKTTKTETRAFRGQRDTFCLSTSTGQSVEDAADWKALMSEMFFFFININTLSQNSQLWKNSNPITESLRTKLLLTFGSEWGPTGR